MPAVAPLAAFSSHDTPSGRPVARPFDDAALLVAARYRTPAAHYYVRSKLRIDPVARVLYELGAVEPFGEIADVACGRGQLGILLLEGGCADAVVGIDWDAKKVATATAAASGLDNARFEHGDVRETAVSAADTVLLVDILHYLTREEQDALLIRAARAARRRIVIRDVDSERGASSLLTQSWEWVTTTLGYNRVARVSPRSFDEMTSILEGEGLTVTRELCSAKALSNVLLIASR